MINLWAILTRPFRKKREPLHVPYPPDRGYALYRYRKPAEARSPAQLRLVTPIPGRRGGIAPTPALFVAAPCGIEAPANPLDDTRAYTGGGRESGGAGVSASFDSSSSSPSSE